MAARIYALAKELNIDSKDLVDLVKKVGITGKGSALASLSDEEAQRVREHLSADASTKPDSVASAAGESVAPAAVRESVAVERKPRAIKIGRSSGPVAKGAAKSKSEGPRPVRAPVPLPPVESVAASGPTEAAQTPDVKLPASSRLGVGGLIGRKSGKAGSADDSIAPIRQATPTYSDSSSRVRSLDRNAGGDSTKRSEGSIPKRREPRINVKMASLPDTPKPAAPWRARVRKHKSQT